MVIETVKKVNWRDEWGIWSWGLELQKRLNDGDFRYTSDFEENGISPELSKAFRNMQLLIGKNRQNTASFVAYLNFKIGEPSAVEMPNEGTDRYWVRINGCVMHFELMDEYEGDGVMNQGIQIPYIDKDGDDTFWLEVINELSKAAKRELDGMTSEFVEEWAEYYS